MIHFSLCVCVCVWFLPTFQYHTPKKKKRKEILTIDFFRLYVLFSQIREFAFWLFINYAYICAWLYVHGRHLKETVLWATITFLRAAINSCEVIKFVNDVLSKHVCCIGLFYCYFLTNLFFMITRKMQKLRNPQILAPLQSQFCLSYVSGKLFTFLNSGIQVFLLQWDFFFALSYLRFWFWFTWSQVAWWCTGRM